MSSRKTYLDFLRIIAIWMVLFNHTNTKGFMLFTAARDSQFYRFYLFFAILIKIAVPLFFMISGALLLDKNEGLRAVFRRFAKYLIILAVASFVLYLYRCFRMHEWAFSVRDFLRMLYSEPLSGAMWFLYVYPVFLLMLPVLRCIAQNLSDDAFIWTFAVFAVISLLPLLDFFVWKDAVKHYYQVSVFVSRDYVLYPLMGYFIEHRMKTEDRKKERMAVLVLISILAILVCCAATHRYCEIINEWRENSCQKFFTTLTYVPAFTVFYGTKVFFASHPAGEKARKAISFLAGGTFGLYLTERICRYETLALYDALIAKLPPFTACCLWIFAACAAGIAGTNAVKRAAGFLFGSRRKG